MHVGEVVIHEVSTGIDVNSLTGSNQKPSDQGTRRRDLSSLSGNRPSRRCSFPQFEQLRTSLSLLGRRSGRSQFRRCLQQSGIGRYAGELHETIHITIKGVGALGHGCDSSFRRFQRRSKDISLWTSEHSRMANAQDGSASGQYFRRIAFMSKSATPHQNFRFGFEPIKNARADSLAHTDSFPARVGFIKSWTADAMTAIPRRR